jgi:hypothetical protein
MPATPGLSNRSDLSASPIRMVRMPFSSTRTKMADDETADIWTGLQVSRLMWSRAVVLPDPGIEESSSSRGVVYNSSARWVLTIQRTNNSLVERIDDDEESLPTAIYAGEAISSQAIQIACVICVPNGKVDSGRDPTKQVAAALIATADELDQLRDDLRVVGRLRHRYLRQDQGR